jgi:hypothetical protein
MVMNGREKMVAHINRKDWWHVPPSDPEAYKKRGKFLASSYREAEFWGRPLNEPQRVRVENPLVGDEAAIEIELLGKRTATEDISVDDRYKLDARLKQEASKRGYDSIVLLSPKGYEEFKRTSKIPRFIELNVFVNGN